MPQLPRTYNPDAPLGSRGIPGPPVVALTLGLSDSDRIVSALMLAATNYRFNATHSKASIAKCHLADAEACTALASLIHSSSIALTFSRLPDSPLPAA
jgi:hypothetical protein